MGEARRNRAIRRAVHGTIRAETTEATLEIVRGYARSAHIWRAVAIVELVISLAATTAWAWR